MVLILEMMSRHSKLKVSGPARIQYCLAAGSSLADTATRDTMTDYSTMPRSDSLDTG
jgi:hypothetical protein